MYLQFYVAGDDLSYNGLAIAGHPTNSPVWQSPVSGTPPVFLGGSWNAGQGQKNITFRNIKFIGIDSYAFTAGERSANEDINLINCIFTNTSGTYLVWFDRMENGSAAEDDGCLFKDCVFRGGSYAVYSANGLLDSKFRFIGNTVEDCSAGIYRLDPDTAGQGMTVFAGNTIWNVSGSFWSSLGVNWSFSCNNTIYGTGGNGLDYMETNYNNIAMRNTGFGINGGICSLNDSISNTGNNYNGITDNGGIENITNEEGNIMKIKVLLVDDEKDFVESLSERLAIREIDVESAYDGDQALSLIKEKDFDVVILYVLMPGKDGIETLQELKKSGSIYNLLTKKMADERRRLSQELININNMIIGESSEAEELIKRVRANPELITMAQEFDKKIAKIYKMIARKDRLQKQIKRLEEKGWKKTADDMTKIRANRQKISDIKGTINKEKDDFKDRYS